MNDIINELRRSVATSFEPDCVEQVVTEMYKRGLKAADIIEQQAARIAELEEQQSDQMFFIKACQDYREKLAESQAREAVLREALRKLIEFEILDTGAASTDELCYEYKEAVVTYNAQADTTALKAIVQRAGEVMRERSAAECQIEMDEQFMDSNEWCAARACRDAIRALPSVTLEDLKGEE